MKIIVSIITRTVNRQITLQRLAKNLIKQKFSNFEWIIVNDGGSKEPVEIVADEVSKRGLFVDVIHNEISKGRSYPVNLGAKKARGKYILIVDDDDYLHDECLLKMVKYIEQFDWLGGVAAYSQIVFEEIKNNRIYHLKYGRIYKPQLSDFLPHNMFYENPTPVHGLLVKKEYFLSIGGFPVDIEYTEDWCCWYKFSKQFDIGLIEEVLAFYSHRKETNKSYKNTASDKKGKHLHDLYQIKWKNKEIRENGQWFTNSKLNYNSRTDIKDSYTWKIGNLILWLPKRILALVDANRKS